MAGRFALVVGSNCDTLNELSFVGGYARGLNDALRGAGWRTVGNADGLLLHPTTRALKDAVEDAFVSANDASATLLIAFIGHGVARGTHNYYLMTTDSPADKPNSDNAFHFTQFVQERLIDFPSMDGLVFLVDACEAKQGLEGAATRWTEVLADNRGRLELLVASGAGNAYDGCFTRTILNLFDTGLADRGDRLLCADLRPAINDTCRKAQTQYFGYSGSRRGSRDPGLWLVPNRARSRDAVTGRPAAGMVDLLTADVVTTDHVRRQLMILEDSGSARLRLVVGPAGSGKSTLLALLIRPRLIDSVTVADNYIKAAVFLDKASTVESVANELAAQLSTSVKGFAAQPLGVLTLSDPDNPTALGSFDIRVVQPLSACVRSGIIHLIVDGLDKPEPGARDSIVAALSHLTSTANGLGHVRVIASSRFDVAELPHAHRIEVTPPAAHHILEAAAEHLSADFSAADLTRLVRSGDDSGWLVIRLLREIHKRDAQADLSFDTFGDVVAARIGLALSAASSGIAQTFLTILAAAGYGPVLPIRLLAAALSTSEEDVSLAEVRDITVEFGSLVARGNPGLDDETLGMSHVALLDPVIAFLEHRGTQLPDGHRAIVDGYHRLERPEAGVNGALVDYWVSAAPRHYLGSGPDTAIDTGATLTFLLSRETARAADNRDRWANWLPVFTISGGADDPDALTARAHLAHWRGASGDAAAAMDEYAAVVADRTRALGEYHRDTLLARARHARWCGEAGDPHGAAARLTDVLADMDKHLTERDHDTLTTRNNLAEWLGQAGEPAKAVAVLEELLEIWPGVVGDDDIAVLIARSSLVGWRAQETHDAGWAVSAYEDLLEQSRDITSPDSITTLKIRNNLADWRGETGDADGAVREFQQLVADRSRVLGADHPDTLLARNNLAAWRGHTTDFDGAVADFEELVKDRERILGPQHPDTVVAQNNLAYWRARAGQ